MWKPQPVKSFAGILYALSYVSGSKNKEGCCRKMWMDVVHRFDLASIFYWQLFYVWKHGRDLGKYFGSFLQSCLYPILKVWWEILTSISQCNPDATDFFKLANNSWTATSMDREVPLSIALLGPFERWTSLFKLKNLEIDQRWKWLYLQRNPCCPVISLVFHSV